MGTDGIDRDISSAVTGLGILPVGTRRFAVAALQNYGIGVWEITGGASLGQIWRATYSGDLAGDS